MNFSSALNLMDDHAEDELTIEAMTMDDLPEVLAIEQNSFDDPWPEDVFRAELRHCWSHCRVLRQDRELIGYIVFWQVADEVSLLNVAVKPGERRHHCGRLLIDYMLDSAREHNARFISLEVRRSNQAAIRLYESGGFKQVGVRPSYYANNGEDAIVMLYDMGSQSGMNVLPGSAQTEA